MIQIINPSALVNGYILNGVAHFTQSTNPTTRNGGGALVAQDIWNDTTNWVRWTYSGAVWRSPTFDVDLNGGVATSGHNSFGEPPVNCPTIFVKSYCLAMQGNATANNGSNYGTYVARTRVKANSTEPLLGTIQNFPLPVGQANNWIVSVNLAFAVADHSGVSVPLRGNGRETLI